jgi:hypothetical protein
MTFVKGGVGNPLGRRAEKPFADALRLEIAAAGENQRALRAIARNLLRIAQIKKGVAALPAIMALADRLDGRPSQESVVATIKHDASDWTREELMNFIRDRAKVIEAKPIATDPHCAAIGVISKRTDTH